MANDKVPADEGGEIGVMYRNYSNIMRVTTHNGLKKKR